MRAKDLLGQQGEELAARYLAGAGLQILARNWRCKDGEIDIVALDQRVLVVCEVKTQIRRGIRDPTRGSHEAEGVAASAPCRQLDHRPGPDLRADQDRCCRGAADRFRGVQHRARAGGRLAGARPHLLDRKRPPGPRPRRRQLRAVGRLPSATGPASASKGWPQRVPCTRRSRRDAVPGMLPGENSDWLLRPARFRAPLGHHAPG